jgi:hypothetical protein
MVKVLVKELHSHYISSVEQGLMNDIKKELTCPICQIKKTLCDEMDHFLGNPEPPKTDDEFQLLLMNDVWAKALFDRGVKHGYDKARREISHDL